MNWSVRTNLELRTHVSSRKTRRRFALVFCLVKMEEISQGLWDETKGPKSWMIRCQGWGDGWTGNGCLFG